MSSTDVVPVSSSIDSSPRRATTAVRLATVIVFALAAIYYVVLSWHWRLAVDSPIMHYVVFLMKHGLKPYSEISDNNMPGAYLTEALAMDIFGGSDLAWRFYEFFLLAMMCAALVALSRRWDPVIGVFAAGMFIVLHTAEGPDYAGERELVLTVLLLIALVALIAAVERQLAWNALIFGLATGLACSIKPTYLPLALAWFAFGLLVLHRRRQPIGSTFLYGLIGMGLMVLADLGFLLHFHCLRAFVFLFRHVLPAYAGLSTPLPLWRLLAHCLPNLDWPLLALAVPLIYANRRRFGSWNWQHWALLIGAIFGVVSYAVQRKGFLHHRYTFLTFFYLLIGIEIFQALQNQHWQRWLAVTSMLFIFFVLIPRTLSSTREIAASSHLELAMESDLQELGGAQALQGKVQCFDLVFGCLDALYHERILEDSGFTGDLLFFPEHPNEATDYYRTRFWRGAEKDPAEVIILSNQELMRPDGFTRLARWPRFEAWLADNYVQVGERHFTYEHFGATYAQPVAPPEQDAYRIYLRKGSALFARASLLHLSRAEGQS